MYNSGDAAEQVVRISLEGTEVALKLTGSAAKNIAAMLYAVWKNRDKNKTKGHQRLSAMLKSGKELKVFTVSEEHLKQFATEAKRYGVVYCALRGKFRDYLDVQAAFRNYSATNALLILATKPDARRLGDKDFWRDQGVYIKRQEFGRPIKIVESNGEYTRDDGSIGVSYNIKRVYDISQTTARTRTPQAVSHDARALLNALIYKRPTPVQSVDELPNGIDAVYDHEQNAVFVRRGLSANDLFCGLSKALAQAELARTGEEYTEENTGFKAQCVSYILGKEFGVEVSGYAFETPADFLRTDDPQTIRAELTDIRDTAYDISARMMRSLEQSKAPRLSEQER